MRVVNLKFGLLFVYKFINPEEYIINKFMKEQGLGINADSMQAIKAAPAEAQRPTPAVPPQGYAPQGYPAQGYPPPHGYPPQGYPPHGYPPPYHNPSYAGAPATGVQPYQYQYPPGPSMQTAPTAPQAAQNSNSLFLPHTSVFTAETSIRVKCPFCGNIGSTVISTEIGHHAIFWALCVSLFWCMGWGILCTDACKDKQHRCAVCGKIIGTYELPICNCC